MLLAVVLVPTDLASAGGGQEPTERLHGFVDTMWTVDDGLPDHSVSWITQTAEGYLWLGTLQGGMAEFDGIRFLPYPGPEIEGFPDAYVTDALEDRLGRRWMASSGAGVLRIEGDRMRAFGCADGLPNEVAVDVLEDRAGGIYVATAPGLSRLDGDHFEVIDPQVWPRHLVEGADGEIWFTSGGRLHRLDGDRVTPVEAYASEAVDALCGGHDGSIWFSTAGGIKRLHAGRETLFPFSDTTVVADSLFVDSAGDLWLGTNGHGPMRLHDGQFEGYLESERLHSTVITDIFEDREGNLWLGDYWGSLHRLRAGAFVRFDHSDGLPSSVVRAVYEDPEGTLWVGTRRGLGRFDEDGMRTFTSAEGLPSNLVYTCLRRSDGSLWIGTAEGAVRLVEGRITETGVSGLPDAAITVLYEDRAGVLWVGCQREHLYRVRDGVATAFDRVPTSAGYVHAMTEDAASNLWIATSVGLFRVSGDDVTRFGVSDGLVEDAVYSLLADGDRLWIGTGYGGLHLLENDQITRVPLFHEPQLRKLVGLIEDDLGGLWVCSTLDVLRARKQDVLDAMADGETGFQYSTLGPADGLGDGVFVGRTQTSTCRRADGSIWFASTSGAIGVEPRALSSAPVVLRVKVEEFVVDGVRSAAEAALEIPPGGATLEIHYTALNLTAPERARFRFRLEGYEGHWTDAGSRRVAYYPMLPPGDYRFRLQAADVDGEFGQTTAADAAVGIRVQPYFYQTRSFALLGTLVGLLSLVGLHQLRTRRIRKETERLQQAVTDRTRDLRQAHDQLEDRVEQRTQELAHANMRLASDLRERERLEKMLLHAQKMESIGRLAGGVAHDLNNLLTVVLGCAELVEAELDDPDQLQKVQDIREGGERAAVLTRQLLTFARQQPVESRLIDLNQIPENFESLVRRLLGKAVQLTVRTSSTPLHVEVDPTQIEQVLMNLAVNARDVMEQGGEFTIETRLATMEELDDEAHQQVDAREHVLMVVSDTGSGMSESVKEHIFEPFFTTKEEGKGTGLGLATCYGIVKQCGGHIWVDSEPGKGTTFKIYLPRADVGELTIDRPRETATPACSETVLLVEDDESVRQITLAILRDCGYEVLEAADGEQALELVEATGVTIDLLLTDVVMPRMGGKELVAQLRCDRPGLRVLFVSGYAENVIVHNGVIDPGASLLQKPFTASALRKRVRHELDAGRTPR